jgi:hypothetical protein
MHDLFIMFKTVLIKLGHAVPPVRPVGGVDPKHRSQLPYASIKLQCSSHGLSPAREQTEYYVGLEYGGDDRRETAVCRGMHCCVVDRSSLYLHLLK